MIVSSVSQYRQQNIKFRGPVGGLLTSSLALLETNPMVNATMTDLVSMVIPRTYIDTKKRNKYAGAETFFREFTGTGIVCLLSGVLAKGIALVANKIIDPKTKINSNSWVSNDGLNVMKHIMEDGKQNPDNFVKLMFNGISGVDGNKKVHWNNIDWANINWVDDKRWSKFKWKSQKYNGMHNRLKSKSSIEQAVTDLLKDKTTDKSDIKHINKILESRITNVLQVNKNISVNYKSLKYNTSVPNFVRDIYGIGRNIFANKNINVEKTFHKLTKINKVKTLGALGLASLLGLADQYINRKITEKRTGKKGFVGDVDYNTNKKQNHDNSIRLKIHKSIAAAGIAALAIGVMKVKSPKDFVKKLEFTGPVTSGNAIKTVYTATLMGRFLASDNDTELRESSFRDYFGFLNWLVLGGFASKGVANLLDSKKKNLFNIDKNGKGVKHWFDDLSLKNHKEIIAKGLDFAKNNIWKVNLHQIAGLIYSTTMLGIVLPSLNIFFTKIKQQKLNKHIQNSKQHITINTKNISPVFKSLIND